MGGGPVTADPLVRFEREHEEALTALAMLERAALGLRMPGDRQPYFAAARTTHAFLAGPVKAHNHNEERALFPELGGDAPLAPFLEEHQTVWRLERDLERALAAEDALRTADTALALVDVLRAHIARENEVLFPLARGLLGEHGLERVARRLEA